MGVQEGDVRFRLWARPIVGGGGALVVPVTLVWQAESGAGGLVGCGGLVEAMERAAQIAARYGRPHPG